MVKLTLNLARYRIRVALTSARPGRHDKLLAALEEVVKVRVGSRISRLFRLILNRKRLQRLLGGILAVLIMTTNLFPPTSAVFSAQPETITLPATEQPVLTEVVRRYPVNGQPRITQGYTRFHGGIDIDGVTGDPVYPVMNGKVSSSGVEFFLGKTVRVSHEDGYQTVYAHLNTISVRVGQEVNTSTKIGAMGATGHAFGDHLHLEAYKNGRNVSPYTILPPR